MSEKNIGYLLLSIGILFMLVSLGIIILTVTGSMSTISVFNIPAPVINTASFMPQIPGLPKPEGSDITILPSAAFNKILNLGVEFMLMYFILSVGFKLSDLGVKLVRTIKTTEGI